MSARHENRDRQGPDTTPFFTYRRGAVVPDQSQGRTPIGDMTNDELYRGIYRPAMATMPACSGDCQQMGGEHCPHPQDCQLKGGGGWLVASFAFGAAFWGGLWAYFKYWG